MNPKIQTVPALEGLRGAAALLVVLSHSSRDGMYLVPGLDLDGTGKLGVWMFFTLSAFLLTRQLMSSGRPLAGPVVLGYLTRRLFRIVPLFLVALLVDQALSRLPPERLVPALLMLHAPDIFWTVPVEFQYYFAIPIVAWLFLRGRLVTRLAISGAVVAASTTIAIADVVSWKYFPVFIAGSFAASVVRVADPARVSKVAIACLIPTVLVVPSVMRLVGLDAVVSTDVPRNTHIVFGLLFAPIVVACTVSPGWQRAMGVRPLVWAGKISFPLYLFHPLALVAVQRSGIPGPLEGVAVLGAAIVMAVAAHRVIETPFRTIGYRIGRIWSGGLRQERSFGQH